MITTLEKIQQRLMLSDKAYYVYYDDKLVDNILDLQNAFKKRYRNFKVGYSFKTNYLQIICKRMLEHGVMAEVVSPEEYKYAKHLGFSDDMIIYNGIIRDEKKILAAAGGAIVNIENIYELEDIKDFCESEHVSVDVGLRVTFPISGHDISRFGFIIGSHDFTDAIRLINNCEWMHLKGLHCHFGSARQLKYWEEKIKVMAELGSFFNVKYIDIGGGMFGKMNPNLSVQFDDYVSSFKDYAKSICKIMKQAFKKEECTLIIEPGTALVGNVLNLRTRVIGIKQDRNIQRIIVNASSSDIGYLCENKDIPIYVESHATESVLLKNASICGCTCLEHDVLKEGVTVGIGIGDIIEFQNTGAYSLNCADNFITPRLDVKDNKGRTYYCGNIFQQQ